jgi:hypothetical protein
MLSAHTDSDFFGIGNPKVSQLFGLVVLLPVVHSGFYSKIAKKEVCFQWK